MVKSGGRTAVKPLTFALFGATLAVFAGAGAGAGAGSGDAGDGGPGDAGDAGEGDAGDDVHDHHVPNVGWYEAVTPCVATGLYPAVVPADALPVHAFIVLPIPGLLSLPVAVTEPQPSKQSGAKGKYSSPKMGCGLLLGMSSVPIKK